MSDFNMILENKKLSDYCEMNEFGHFILKPTCAKGLLPSTIDLLLASHKQSFMRSDVYETGISILRKTFAKGKPKAVFYSRYKTFNQDTFNETLKSRISLPDQPCEFLFEIF